MTTEYRHLFGPVPSRRFGRSLGVDLTPFKTCNLNCIFCQLGPTTIHTSKRSELISIESVKAEFSKWLQEDGQADQITLAGSGEPTLHIAFGEIINFIKSRSNIPVALLTNGTTLHLPEVREAARIADIVKISLSAWDQSSFTTVNRPCPDATFDQLLSGEIQFRKEFSGKLFLEVFLLKKFNANQKDVKCIAELAKLIQPDKIQLNTCVRPPAEEFAEPASRASLLRLAESFVPRAELIPDFSSEGKPELKVNEQAILDMIRRRPCTSPQIAEVFGLHLNHVSKYIGKLLGEELIKPVRKTGNTYYVAS